MPTDLPAPHAWTGLAAEPDYPLALPEPAAVGEPPLAMLFRRIPAGSFVMGSRSMDAREEPRHRVVLEQEFWLAKFVVTQAEYARVVRAVEFPAKFGLGLDPSHFKGARRPVEQVSWDDAMAWCAALRAWPGLPAEIRELRLPSEAEWEYACRAEPALHRTTDYYSGDGDAALAEVGWYDGNAGDTTHDVEEAIHGRPETHPAGLVGMHGHVWEWCGDVWDARAYRKRPDGWVAQEWNLADAGDDATSFLEPITPGDTPSRVLRGGSWLDPAGRCRSAYRYWIYGFRVCLVRGPVGAGGAQEQFSPAEEPRVPETDGTGGAGAEGASFNLAHETISRGAGSNFFAPTGLGPLPTDPPNPLSPT